MTIAQPCFTRYHFGCIRMGPPFRTRLPKQKGLSFSSALRDMPNFICEACTVRAQLDRELQCTSPDIGLLALERARLIDMSHHWADTTLTQYHSKLNILRKFEQYFGVSPLQPTILERPPTGPAISIMWAQQHYTLRPGRGKSQLSNEGFVSFSTARGLRSAAAHYLAWDLQVSDPQAAYDALHRPLADTGTMPTDSLAYSYMTSGMSRRLGEESTPSHALLERHIQWIDNHLNSLYEVATTDEARAELSRAGLANLVAWLGWLRALELFSLFWNDLTILEPQDGPELDLPVGTGAFLARLLPETKSSRTITADVVMAYTSGSGLSLGKWTHRLRASLGHHEIPSSADRVFQHPDGTPWTSLYFRSTYLWPLLHMQCIAGDAHLKPFDGINGRKTLEQVFYSMHSYRRGSRSVVSKRRPPPLQVASPDEVNEHGRWRVKRSNMKMDQLYLSWDIIDRLALTLFCM